MPWILADTERAEALWTAALPIAHELADDETILWIDTMLVSVAWERGDLERALVLHDRNLRRARASGNRILVADVLHHMGEVLRDLERYVEAETHLVEASAILRDLEQWRALANNVHSLGDLALDRGDLAKAASIYREAIELDRIHAGSEGPRFVAYCLAGLARVLAERGQGEDAASVWGAICAAEDTFSFRMLGSERRRYEKRLTGLESSAAWTHGRTLTLERIRELAETAVD